MKFTLQKGRLEKCAADLVVVLCPQQGKSGDKEKAKAVLQDSDGGVALDKILNGRLSTLIATEDFSGDAGTSRLVATLGALPARYVLLLGAGNSKQLSVKILHRLAATIARAADQVKAVSAACFLQHETMADLPAARRAQSLVQGILLGQYRFDQFRAPTACKPSSLTAFTLLSDRINASLQSALDRGQQFGAAACQARDLVNLPSNICTPDYLVEQARALAKRSKLTCKILGQKELEAERMGLILGVNKGSPRPAYLIHLRYTPAAKPRKKIAIVGKGITFDTGGYDLKPSRSMIDMKDDMAGAATMLCTMQVVAAAKARVQVDCYIPTTENCLDGKAVKPSDIMTSRSGKFIENVNTDAEGRLVLADAIDYAADDTPDLIIDAATLTGGVKYALGENFTAVLGTDQKTIDTLINFGKLAGEPMWQLPLEEDYLAGFKGGFADLKNCGTSGASTITAALFLGQFVRNIPWVHLDIAESAWADAPDILCPKGGTGSPVRTLCEFILSL